MQPENEIAPYLIGYEWSKPTFDYSTGRLVGIFVNPYRGLARLKVNGCWEIDDREYLRRYLY